MGAFPYENMGWDILENIRMTCMQLQHSRWYIDSLTFMKIREYSIFEEFLEIGYIIDEAGCGGSNP